MENLGQKQNIVVRRIKKGKQGGGGGAWKVAMADFALAMMALFLVLWIISSSNEEQRLAIAGYFQDPQAYKDGALSPSKFMIDMGGSPPGSADNQSQTDTINPDQTLQAEDIESMAEAIEQKRMEEQMQKIQERIDASPTLSPFKDQLLLDITSEGVRLQIVDKTNRPMFDAGSVQLKYYSEDILWELAPLLATMHNRLSISGHTDATTGTNQRAEDDVNWRISSSRADAARRALMESGIPKEQVAQVIGMGDTAPLLPEDPYNAMNRRISITLLTPKSDRTIKDRDGQINFEFIEHDNGEVEGEAGDKIDATQHEESVLERAGKAIENIQKQREAEDNTYDNPPNQEEVFW